MTSETALLKRELRGQLRAWLREVSAARREEMSARARDLLARQRVWREARRVLFYAAMRDELDLRPLLERALAEGKTVGLPRFVRETGVYEAAQITDFARDCAAGKLGILEPTAHCPPLPLNTLDLALVPGLGYDTAGHRLGRGGGFYDRLLARVAGTKCGVAFDEQMKPQIPAEAHDITLNCILTPTQWLEVPPRPPAALP
jgi:5-formyltetrahydrofolate cyclo-ligase